MLRAAAQLERCAAQDQGDEHQEQRQIERREHRGVDVRECREQGAAGRYHPDFVAIPDRRYRHEYLRAVFIAPAQEGQQHADAIVEALEDEEAGEQNGYEDEP